MTTNTLSQVLHVLLMVYERSSGGQNAVYLVASELDVVVDRGKVVAAVGKFNLSLSLYIGC